MTISELRENQARRIAREYDIDTQDARHITRLYYRLAYQSETECIIANDSRLYTPYRMKREEQETAKRAQSLLKAVTETIGKGYSLRYAGIYPYIEKDGKEVMFYDCYMYERKWD